MQILNNQRGASYLVTVLMVALGLGGAAMYGSKTSLTSSKVASTINATHIEKSKIDLHLSQYAKALRESLDNAPTEPGTLRSTASTLAGQAPYNCNSAANLEDGQWHYADNTRFPKTSIICKTINQGKKVGYLISGKRKVQNKREIASKLFIPYRIPIGYVKIIIGETDISRENYDFPDMPKTLKKGSEIFLNDRISTKANGKIHFAMKDKTQLFLGPNSNFAFTFFNNKNTQGAKKGGYYYLINGYVRALFKKLKCTYGSSGCGGYEIRTRNATLGIRGTEIAVFAKIDTTINKYITVFSVIEGGPVELLHGRPEFRHTLQPNKKQELLPFVPIGSNPETLIIKTDLPDFQASENGVFNVEYIRIKPSEHIGVTRPVQLIDQVDKNHDLDLTDIVLNNIVNQEVLPIEVLNLPKATDPSTDWIKANNIDSSITTGSGIDFPNPAVTDRIELCYMKRKGIIKKAKKWSDGCKKRISFPLGSEYQCSAYKTKYRGIKKYKERKCTLKKPKPSIPGQTQTTSTLIPNSKERIIDYIDITTQLPVSNTPTSINPPPIAPVPPTESWTTTIVIPDRLIIISEKIRICKKSFSRPTSSATFLPTGATCNNFPYYTGVCNNYFQTSPDYGRRIC